MLGTPVLTGRAVWDFDRDATLVVLRRWVLASEAAPRMKLNRLGQKLMISNALGADTGDHSARVRSLCGVVEERPARVIVSRVHDCDLDENVELLDAQVLAAFVVSGVCPQ